MGDLLAGEFAHFKHSNEQREPLSIIAGSKPVAHLPCTPPPLIPETLAVQKYCAAIKSSADRLLKRIYGDKEKSEQMTDDVAELQKEKAFFDLQFNRLTGLYGEQAGYSEFIQALKKVRDLSDKPKSK